MGYAVRPKVRIRCGFLLTSANVRDAAAHTSKILEDLPSTLYRSLDYKTTSAIIGSVFCDELAIITGAYVNPIEKGHPDLIPVDGVECTEEELRNYPDGLEVKCTVGNIEQGANLRAGTARLESLTGITWQAHHREVSELLGLVWDFVDSGRDFNYPAITGAFYADDLAQDDWGKISGTTGRNTKVTGMRSSGKRKMGNGWVVLYDNPAYIMKYSRLLGFAPPKHRRPRRAQTD